MFLFPSSAVRSVLEVQGICGASEASSDSATEYRQGGGVPGQANLLKQGNIVLVTAAVTAEIRDVLVGSDEDEQRNSSQAYRLRNRCARPVQYGGTAVGQMLQQGSAAFEIRLISIDDNDLFLRMIEGRSGQKMLHDALRTRATARQHVDGAPSGVSGGWC